MVMHNVVTACYFYECDFGSSVVFYTGNWSSTCSSCTIVQWNWHKNKM